MMQILKLVTFCGIFEVGTSGVGKIEQHPKDAGRYTVTYWSGRTYKQVDVYSRDVLVYWG